MSGRIVPALWAAITGALATVLLLALFYALAPTLHTEFAVDPPRLMTGVYPGERDGATGLTYAWTGRDVALRLPGLDRRIPWTVQLRLRGGRENAEDNPMLRCFVDGVGVLAHQSRTAFEEVSITIPPRTDRPRGALVTLQLSTTFVPGPSDPRPLGVMVDALTLSPRGLPLPATATATAAAASGAALAAALALLGLTRAIAGFVALPLAIGLASVLARGFAPFTDLPARTVWLAGAISGALVIVVAAIERIRRRPLSNTARFAAAMTAAAAFLKSLALLHPDMPVGDALFQAHRFQEVLRGNYYFTSIAPGNYLFPYAPGLYLAASPFAELVRREAGDVVLLRLVVVCTDAAAGALIYGVVARTWRDRLAGALGVALYQVLPLDFLVTTVGNLTNAFAQSLAVVSLAAMSSQWLRLAVIPTAALTVILAAAFLSHTSTFAILAATAFAVALMFAARGGPSLRSARAAVAVACAAAVVVAVAVYYGHFIDIYRSELGRIGRETAAGSADAGGRGITERALAVPRYLHIFLGAPALLLATAGGVHLWRRGARDRLTLVLAGWGLTCLAFLLLGVLTPVDMRYYLASLPAVAIAGAAGASHGWTSGGRSRVLTVALLAWSAWLGIATWWSTLG
jgi:hypothetical protein